MIAVFLKEGFPMPVTLPIPDDLAARLGDASDVSRRALEAFAAEEYRAGRLNNPDLRQLLGFGTHVELDGFLRARGIFENDAMASDDMEDENERRYVVKELLKSLDDIEAGRVYSSTESMERTEKLLQRIESERAGRKAGR
jgi:hypothetical protein